jgi:hypothetical protein
MMLELNIFSGIMYASLIGLVLLGIWANKKDYQEIKELLKE